MDVISLDTLYAKEPRANGGNLDNLVTTVIPDGYNPGMGWLAAALTDTLPISEIPVTHTASELSTFKDLWYDRIHVIPGAIALGSLLSTQERDVEVWSSYRVPVELEEINGQNTDGLSIGGGPAAPNTFSELQSEFYSISITPEGPPVINATYEFVFDVGSTLLPVTGQRLTIINFMYENGVSEQYSWLTDIHQTVEDERRLSLRVKPRQSLACNYSLPGPDFTTLNGLLYTGNEREYAVPLWMDAHYIKATIVEGTSVINFDTGYKRFRAGGLVMIWDNETHFEAIEIEALDSSSLTLSNPTQSEFAKAFHVVPLRRCKIVGKPNLQKLNMDYGTANINFSLTELYSEPSGTYTQYNGVDVLLDRTFLFSQISDSVFKDRLTVDGRTGPFSTFALRKATKEYRTQNWLVRGLQRKYELLQFLHSRKGRQKQFYFPSWRNDVQVTATIGAASTGAQVTPSEYDAYEDEGGRAAYILLHDGTSFFRDVTFPSEGVISFGTALGQDVEPEDIQVFSFMHLVRFDSDTIDVSYTNDQARVSVPLVTVI